MRNFLVVVNGSAEFLRESLVDHPNPDVKVWLENLAHAGELMDRTVNQLMGVSVGLEAALRFEKVHLGVAVGRVCSFYQRRADRKAIALVYGTEGDATVWTDRVAAAAVLDNLLSNAVKYSPRGASVEVSVTASAGHVTCSVRDHGPELDAADIERLFQPGARLDPVPTGGE